MAAVKRGEIALDDHPPLKTGEPRIRERRSMTPLVDAETARALADPQRLLSVLDFAGVAVFAATGALAAAREKHDLVTFAFFAAITGVGGGTLRDLLLGVPVFWVQDWRYIGVCIAASVAIWMIGRRDWRFRALLWLDAIGLGAYGVMGAAKAEANRRRAA
jgi:uncharacterized membrane protein YeiH